MATEGKKMLDASLSVGQRDSKGHVLVDDRWVGDHGIGRFAKEYLSRAKNVSLLSDHLAHSPSAMLDPVRVWRCLAKLNPPLYFTPGYNAPLSTKVPYVLTLCDLNHIDIPENASFLKSLYYSRIIKPAVLQARCVLTISQFSQERVMAWSGVADSTRIVVVGCGVGGQFSPEGPVHEPGYPYYFYVGNRKPHKNIHRALQAYANSAYLNDIKLVITGVADNVIGCELERLGLMDRVVFTGQLSDQDLAAFYRGAVATVFPSLYEGFGLPIVESLACGTAVVTSDRGAMKEVAGEAAVLVDPYSIDSIQSGLEVAATDNGASKALRLRQASNFQWDQVYERIESVLERVR